MPRILPVLLILSMFLPSAAGQGSLLYDQSFDGASLLTAPGATFPTRVPAVLGSSLEFGAGVVSVEVLFRLPLIPAGTLPPGTPTTLVVDITQTLRQVDSDLSWGPADGGHILLAGVADNVGGCLVFHGAVDQGSTAAPFTENSGYLLPGIGVPSVGTNLAATSHACVVQGSASSTLFYAGSSASYAYVSTPFDVTQALEFVVVAGNAAEEYQIDQVRVRLVCGVPGPAATCMDVDPDLAVPPVEPHCGGCGDCNLDGLPAEILDALVAAQIGVALVTPSQAQADCCDVNSSLAVDVLDALVMAQAAAGLPVMLACP